MKVLHVVSALHKAGGGTSEVIPRLCRELCRAGNEVIIACLGVGDFSEESERARQEGVVISADVKFPRGRIARLIGWSPDFGRELEHLVSWADLVHVHGHWMYPMWAACWTARRLGKPYVMMPHGFLAHERLKISKWKKILIGALIERRLLKYASAVVATSDQEAVGIRQYGVESPIHIMPIGLDLEGVDSGVRSSELLQRLGCDLSRKHLLYFSRLTPIKGLDLLAQAWSDVKQDGWQLLIVGPDDRGYAERVKQMFAEDIRCSSAVVHGPVFGKDKYDLLKSVDAFVLPTRSENWSIAVAEAMAARLPVVCTKGAPWSCLNETGSGKWVDVSSAGIKSGLEIIMSSSKTELEAMGDKAREWIGKNLAWHRICDSMIICYNWILTGGEKTGKKNRG